MAAPPCDECGAILNQRFPLRLVAAGGPDAAPTQQRWLCLGCIGETLDAFRDSGRTCPACADLSVIFEHLVEAVKASITSGDQITAIHVPPNKVPHSEDCEYAA